MVIPLLYIHWNVKGSGESSAVVAFSDMVPTNAPSEFSVMLSGSVSLVIRAYTMSDGEISAESVITFESRVSIDSSSLTLAVYGLVDMVDSAFT